MNKRKADRKIIRSELRKAKLKGYLVAAVILASAVVCAVVFVPKWIEAEKNKALEQFVNTKQSLSTDSISSKLEASSELVTSTVTIKGFSEFTDGGVWVLNRGDFAMVYSTEVKAGIDIKKVDFAVDNMNGVVYIYVPSAEILSVKVLPDTIKYYNESFSLFNLDKKDDANKAQALAEEDAKRDAYNTGLLELADSQSQTLIKGILEDVVNDYEMNFVRSYDELKSIRKTIERNAATTDMAVAAAEQSANK